MMLRTFLLTSAGFEPGLGLPVSDRGFRYGMSVFETIAIHNGKPLFANEHLEKLQALANHVRFRTPAGWREAVMDQLDRCEDPEGVCRAYITAGDGGMELEVTESRVALIFESAVISAPETIAVSTAITHPYIPTLPAGKTGNYWANLIANAQSGNAQTILFTPDGTVLGGATSNLFLVKDGEIVTPMSVGDIRHGVVRDWVLSHFPAGEAQLTLTDLDEAEDVFLTNSRFGVLRIAELDGRKLAGHRLVEEIWERYRSEVLHA